MTATPLEQQVWVAALEFLSEAERSSASAIPRMTVHAAYYAMFHAARAVLLKAEGLEAPTKHNVVVSRFGYLAKQANSAEQMRAGRMLNNMRQERLRSDYDTGHRPTPEQATEAVKTARLFLAQCAEILGFSPP